MLYWCHVPLFLWFCCMCGRCSRYLGINSPECWCVFNVFPVVTSVVCPLLLLFFVICTSLFFCFLPVSVCVTVCLWRRLFVTFSVLHFVHCWMSAGTAWCTCECICVPVIQSVFVGITTVCVCVCARRGSITGFGQSRGDSCFDRLQRERHGLPPQCLPGSAPPHPARCE